MFAVQFVNILDFMIVMPLGPDLARELGINTAHLGLIGASYTLAAALAGLVGSRFLDRFDRKRALFWAMLGLVVSTALAGLSFNLTSLLFARLLAGAFGGPATSLAIAKVTDVVPVERRGRAMGTVMGAFSVASILGVPLSLEVARFFGFRAPFFCVALVGCVVMVLALRQMPPEAAPPPQSKEPRPAPPLQLGGAARWSLTATALVTLGVFSIIPNLSAYLQHNLGYPREHLGLLYLCGGSASFVAMRVTGILVDRIGATWMVLCGTVLYLASIATGFLLRPLLVPILLVFSVFMMSGSVRMVPLQTLASRVPSPFERAQFFSVQSAVQHLFSACGAATGVLLLDASPAGSLLHTERLAWFSICLAAAVPLVARHVERSLGRADSKKALM